MKSPIFGAFGFLLTFILLFQSCVSPDSNEDSNTLRPKVNRNVNTADQNANTEANANLAEDDLVKLDRLINLPFEPKFNDYRQEPVVPTADDSRVPGPADKKLTVVLKFTKKDTDKLLKKVAIGNPPFDSETEAESWFPAELIAKSNTSGDGSLKGRGYNAEDFFRSPFNTGTLIHINDTDYFVLILQTQ